MTFCAFVGEWYIYQGRTTASVVSLKNMISTSSLQSTQKKISVCIIIGIYYISLMLILIPQSGNLFPTRDVIFTIAQANYQQRVGDD